MQDATFGEAPTFSTDVAFSLDLSPDKKAFTATLQRPAGCHRRHVGRADRDAGFLVLASAVVR